MRQLGLLIPFGASLALLLLTGTPVTATPERSVYDLSIRGITVGVLTLMADEAPTTYSLAGRITNTGITRVFRQFRYNGQVQGRIADGTLRPTRYSETADTGTRASAVTMTYRNAVPTVLSYQSTSETGPGALDPRTQVGSVDPLTAVYALLRSVPVANACQTNVTLFDGRRQSRIVMARAGTEDGLPLCRGIYERLAGFTPEQIARHRQFDFVLRYRAGSNGRLDVRDVTFSSVYGRARITRR